MATSGTLKEVAIALCNERNWRYEGIAGDGAFKTVYRIMTQTGEARALKLFHDRSPRTPREIDAIRKCTHPNIARLFEVGTLNHSGDEIDFTLEEFLGGGTLDHLVARTRLSGENALEIGTALIPALGHLKTLGIVHRDIKPANILLREDGKTPVLVDFGLARDLSRSSLTQTWLSMGPGTPLFAPPEQLNNNKDMIDWRSDQFSLGVTLAVACLAVHPYQYAGEEITGEVVARVAARASPRPDLFDLCRAAGLPCLARMVSPWPVGRFRSPSELETAWAQQK
jgi:serine/threonine protein kinase